MKQKAINPHDQSVIEELDVSTPEQVNEAVKRAKEAFPGWRDTPIAERIAFIKKYRQALVDNKEQLSKLTSQEMGKPLSQARDDVDWELGYIDDHIGSGPSYLADETLIQEGNENYRIVFEPYGVAACIAPWNFPLGMFNSGVIPALIAGNTVVFKPSEWTTLSQKFCTELLQQTGLPKGVLELVIGAGEVGSALVDAEIDLVWFTGSTRTGHEIYKKAGEKFIKAICELGGSSAGIVFADHDMKLTKDNLYWSRFLNCGQVCSSVKRLFVERPVLDEVLKEYVDRLKTVKLGNPLDDHDFGPLVNQKQLKLLEEQVSDAVAKGAKVEIGGKRPADPELAKGNYFEPTILTNINFDMRVMHEEVFGPVLPVIPFDTEEEAIEMANRTEYGLTSEVYTTDMEKAERVARQLQSGVVAINTSDYYKPVCPIGGYKNSGIGREYGKIGMQEFAQVKLIAVNKG